MRAWLTVLRTGPLTTVQDLGRPGLAHLAVPPSGALDRGSLTTANRLVGNPPDLAGLEVTGGGLTVRAGRAVTLAVTGAAGAVEVDGHPAAWGRPLRVPEGGTLSLGRPVADLRGYVAVAGGVDAGAVLGSRATDLLTGLGPAPLQVGQRLPVGDVTGVSSSQEALPRWSNARTTTLRLHRGPRADWFSAQAWHDLTGGDYAITPDSSRTALRLLGAGLRRSHDGELPSEGLVTGAVQVPSSGQPLVFLADHPTTGGYPVIGVVDPADLDRCGQLAPGQLVRFTTAT